MGGLSLYRVDSRPWNASSRLGLIADLCNIIAFKGQAYWYPCPTNTGSLIVLWYGWVIAMVTDPIILINFGNFRGISWCNILVITSTCLLSAYVWPLKTSPFFLSRKRRMGLPISEYAELSSSLAFPAPLLWKTPSHISVSFWVVELFPFALLSPRAPRAVSRALASFEPGELAAPAPLTHRCLSFAVCH